MPLLKVLKGYEASSSSMLEWLFTPIDPDRVHQVGVYISWHGRLMTIGWGFCIPLGIIAARFFKITPKQNWPEHVDNRFWWKSHRYFQNVSAYCTATAILLIGYHTVEFTTDTSFHTWLGWSVVIMTLIQIYLTRHRGTKGGPTAPAPDGSLRGDHYDMTPRRLFFEYFHKIHGYCLLLIACYCIISGMWIANAYNWMWLALGIWWGMLILLSIYLQRLGACFDTYQAIWGNDKSLPGNQRKPVGIGINTDTPWQPPEKENEEHRPTTRTDRHIPLKPHR